MTKAFIRLKEILPKSENIQSKKQIVDQVRICGLEQLFNKSNCKTNLKVIIIFRL